MKKITLIILVSLFVLTPFLFAQEEAAPADAEGNEFFWDDEDEVYVNLKTSSWTQNRSFEIGLLYINDIHIANNVFSLNQLFSKVIDIDLNDFPDVMQTQMGINIKPIFFNYDSKNGWGFGLETGVQATGMLGLNADFPILKDANNKESDFGFAAFFNISPNGFFHVSDFKISVKPTLFFPMAYTKSKIAYTLEGENTYANFIYDINMYVPIDENDNFAMPSPGFDLSASVEYPLSKKLNLEDIHSLLDFDVGASISALPIVPGTMEHYERVWGYYTMAKNNGKYLPIDPEEDEDDILTDSDSDSESLTGKQSIFRPFKFHTWADWRPLGSELLTVSPLIGFAINPLYVDVASLEIGISGLLNINNLFYTKLGINRFDRMWINSLDLVLNFRAVEINWGIDIRSQEFLKSWQFSGFGYKFGLIFGW